MDQFQQILLKLYEDEAKRRENFAIEISNDLNKINTVWTYLSRREHIIDFIIDWCWTFDPRNQNIGLPTTIPWIPWQQQIDFIEWFYNLYLHGKSGLIEKSRDQGATWLFCLLFLREWLFEEGFTAGIASNKFDSVDDRDDPDSIFSKLRALINFLPKWLMPNNYNEKIGNIHNQDMNSTIKGEAGDEIGRGGRTSVFFVDEFAYLEHPESADSALSRTTDSRFYLSTPKGMNYFGQLRASGRLPVFTFTWRKDPRVNKQWYDTEKAKSNPVIWAQEVDISYQASVEGTFIDPRFIASAVNADVGENYNVCTAGLDISGGRGRNKSVLAIRKGAYVRCFIMDFDNGVDLTYKTIEMCIKYGVEVLNYDKIGVGYAVESTLARIDQPVPFDIFGVDGGVKASEKYYPEFEKKGYEIFQNCRAEWWYNIRKLLENTYNFTVFNISYNSDSLIVLEDDNNVIQQLSYPKEIQIGHKIGIESKRDMASRGIQSPDHADAIVMAFIPHDIIHNKIWAGYKDCQYKQYDPKIEFSTFTQKNSTFYIVLKYYNTGLYGLFCCFDRTKKVLYVYNEIFMQNVILGELVYKISNDRIVPGEKIDSVGPYLEGIFCDETMFADNNDIKKKLRNDYNIHIKHSRSIDFNNTVVVVREIINRRQISINGMCKNLDQQMRGWKYKEGVIEDGYPMCEALCMAINEIRGAGESFDDDFVFYAPYSKEKQKIHKMLYGGETETVATMNTFNKNRDENDFLAW